LKENVRATMDLYDYCLEQNVRLIYASSAATYGDGTQGFDDDDSCGALARLRPLNAYGWSKHVVDRRLARLRKDGRKAPPQCVGLKFFNVYGPNEYHKGDMQSLVAKAYPTAAAGRPVTLFRSHRPEYPDGGQLRDFIYVRDTVDVMLWLLDHPKVSGLFNVGTGKARSFRDLVLALCQAVGKPADIQYIDTPVAIREKYQYFTEAKVDRLRAVGYTREFTSVEEGVGDYVRRFLSQTDPFR
jgi:ADP-L-glycero-D-manno-heptose 6-epimerase